MHRRADAREGRFEDEHPGVRVAHDHGPRVRNRSCRTPSPRARGSRVAREACIPPCGGGVAGGGPAGGYATSEIRAPASANHVFDEVRGKGRAEVVCLDGSGSVVRPFRVTGVDGSEQLGEVAPAARRRARVASLPARGSRSTIVAARRPAAATPVGHGGHHGGGAAAGGAGERHHAPRVAALRGILQRLGADLVHGRGRDPA